MIDRLPGTAPVPGAVIAPDVVVGLGARAAATAAEILALVDMSLEAHDLCRRDLSACVTIAGKERHPALVEAAEILGVPLLARSRDDLDITVPNPSAAASRHLGLPSVAEAAALFYGPLIAEKRRSANATCALSRRLPVYASTAASTASTLSTSHAGA